MKREAIFLVIAVLVPLLLIGQANADIWTEFGALLKKVLGVSTCVSAPTGQIVDSVVKCSDEYDAEKERLSDQELLHEAGCCLYGRFQHCVHHKVEKICTRIATNITDLAINYFKIFMTSDCKSPQQPRYPSFECDALLFPERTWMGIIGLASGFALIGIMATTITVYTCTLVRRRGYQSYVSV